MWKCKARLICFGWIWIQASKMLIMYCWNWSGAPDQQRINTKWLYQSRKYIGMFKNKSRIILYIGTPFFFCQCCCKYRKMIRNMYEARQCWCAFSLKVSWEFSGSLKQWCQKTGHDLKWKVTALVWWHPPDHLLLFRHGSILRWLRSAIENNFHETSFTKFEANVHLTNKRNKTGKNV